MAIGVNWKEIWATPTVWKDVWQQTPPVEVPDVVGQSQASGTAELEGVGFVVAVDTAYSDTVPLGDIISQSPTAGSFASLGSTVTITVSLGAAPTSDESVTGGWAAMLYYEQERERRRRRRRELEEAEEAAAQIPDPVSQEIAEILQRQEREDEKRAEIERLRAIARDFHESELFTAKVNDAIKRARERQTIASLLNLDRELRRMIEEEEAFAVMMVAIQDLQ